MEPGAKHPIADLKPIHLSSYRPDDPRDVGTKDAWKLRRGRQSPMNRPRNIVKFLRCCSVAFTDVDIHWVYPRSCYLY